MDNMALENMVDGTIMQGDLNVGNIIQLRCDSSYNGYNDPILIQVFDSEKNKNLTGQVKITYDSVNCKKIISFSLFEEPLENLLKNLNEQENYVQIFKLKKESSNGDLNDLREQLKGTPTYSITYAEYTRRLLNLGAEEDLEDFRIG